MKKWPMICLCGVFCLHASNENESSYPILGTLSPIHETKIGTQVSGRVKNIFVNMGERIKKGQVLIELDGVFLEIELKKQTALTELAEANFQEADKDLKRLEPLWEKNPPSISQKNYEDACLRSKMRKAQLDQAMADLENTRQKIKETKISSPYDGIIVKRNVDFGESVTMMPAVTVVEIIDDSKLIFEFSLPQDLLTSIDWETATVDLEIPNRAPLQKGKISLISPQVEKETRTFLCQVVIDNFDGKIHPGIFVKGNISWAHSK